MKTHESDRTRYISIQSSIPPACGSKYNNHVILLYILYQSYFNRQGPRTERTAGIIYTRGLSYSDQYYQAVRKRNLEIELYWYEYDNITYGLMG